jgi:N-acetylmuramoyl-L-alanine amidase-like protein
MTGRPPATDPEGEGELERAIGSVSHNITDPVAKLRYLRGSVADARAAHHHLRAVPSAQLRWMLYRILSVAGLRHTIDVRSLGYPARPEIAGGSLLVLSRIAVAAAALLVAVGLVSVAYKAARPAARPVEASAPRPASPARVSPPVAEPGPELQGAAGIAPSAVWLVENGADFEQYSNGLRIDTSFAVPGPPRRYRVFEADGTFGPEAHSVPVGILFHTTESDVWPLEATFNENLRDSSHRLLRYVSRNRLYHYLIDRFGRVYRVVGEDGKANHAGHSVWAADGRTYLSLNHAFFGVAFETRWDGGRALPITQAQLASGRMLTQYLRQRYGISADMCVTHGLTSVNPRTHRIGHHLDWARGFPFEAFGLPDQYSRPAPSVAAFGFGYDEEFLRVLDEPWPGVRAAERELAEQAAIRGTTVEQVRRERQDLYDRWLAEQVRDDEAERGGSTPARTARTTTSGG